MLCFPVVLVLFSVKDSTPSLRFSLFMLMKRTLDADKRPISYSCVKSETPRLLTQQDCKTALALSLKYLSVSQYSLLLCSRIKNWLSSNSHERSSVCVCVLHAWKHPPLHPHWFATLLIWSQTIDPSSSEWICSWPSRISGMWCFLPSPPCLENLLQALGVQFGHSVSPNYKSST